MSQYGRVRLRPARLRRTSRSSPTTTRARRSGRRPRRRSACCSPTGRRADDRLRGPVHRPRRRRRDARARRRATLTLGPALQAAGRRREPLTPPLVFHPATAPLDARREPYRGRIQVDVVDGKLRAINVVGARAVPLRRRPVGDAVELGAGGAEGAGRRRALVRARDARKSARRSTSYADTRSQMYLGVATRRAATTAAVDATKGQVVLYDGKVATTYFSSTSGGADRVESRTGSGTAAAVPRLRAGPVRRHLAVPRLGPGAGDGEGDREGAQARPGRSLDATTTPNPRGRVGEAELVTPLDPVDTSPATKLRGAIGLRSTWFTLGVMSLTPPAPNRRSVRRAR